MEFTIDEEYLGEWEPLRYDKEYDVQILLRIRPLTEEESDRINKKWGKMKMNKRQGVRQRQVPVENQREVGIDRVLFMWTGIKNGFIKATNQATADWFGKRLGKEFKVGDRIQLPQNLYHPKSLDKNAPRPLDEIKRLMIENDTRISSKVVEVGMGTDDEMIEDADEAKEEFEQEKELEKN
jgi:hypothetical protein